MVLNKKEKKNQNNNNNNNINGEVLKVHNKDGKSSFNTREVIFLVITTCILSFSMAILISKKYVKPQSTIQDKSLLNFIEQYNYIADNYIDGADKDELINNAIKGMVEGLEDPYSNYFDETSSDTFNARLNGNYEGIGIEILKYYDGYIYVLEVFEGSEAFKKGLKVGDVILTINDIDVKTLTNTEFLNIVKNSSENIKLKIKRENNELEFDLKKNNVNIQSVESKLLDDKIGYIKVDVFAINTSNQLQTALDNLEKEGIDGLIIDLRNNSGGHLSTADEVLSMFIPKDKVIYQIETQGKVEKYYSSGSEGKKYKIAVLVNENSASASELVAATLREQLGATIVGKTTYGKGTVQEKIKLTSGVEYKVTTKRWLTSEGNTINEVGVEPDVVLDTDDDTIYIEKAVQAIKYKDTN